MIYIGFMVFVGGALIPRALSVCLPRLLVKSAPDIRNSYADITSQTKKSNHTNVLCLYDLQCLIGRPCLLPEGMVGTWIQRRAFSRIYFS